MSGWVKFVKETAASYGIPYREALSVASQFWQQVKNEPKYANKPRARRARKTRAMSMPSLARARKRGTIVPSRGKRTVFGAPELATILRGVQPPMGKYTKFAEMPKRKRKRGTRGSRGAMRK